MLPFAAAEVLSRIILGARRSLNAELARVGKAALSTVETLTEELVQGLSGPYSERGAMVAQYPA